MRLASSVVAAKATYREILAPRRRALLLVVVVCAAAAGPANPARGQSEELAPGSANASAQVGRVRLFYGGFGIQSIAGVGVASYRNQKAQASGAPVDLSAATGLLGAAPEGTTPAFASTDEGTGTSTTALTEPPIAGRATVTATHQPASTSAVDLVEIDLPGIVRVGAGQVDVATEFVAGSYRQATAMVDIAELSLAGGLVELSGLHWEATHRSGSDARAEGAFSLGGIRVAGLPIPLVGVDLGGVLELVDRVLGPVGLVLNPPEVVRLPDGSIEVTALRIGFANSELGAQLLAPIVAGLRPVVLPVTGALIEANSQLGLAGLVIDIALGVVDGSGGLEVYLGGSYAGTSEPARQVPLSPAPTVAPTTSTPASAPLPAVARPRSVAPPAGGPSQPPVVAVGASADADQARCVLVFSPRRAGPCRGSNVPAAVATIAVALVGMGAVEQLARQRRATRAAVKGARS